jgi:hypothetical protein
MTFLTQFVYALKDMYCTCGHWAAGPDCIMDKNYRTVQRYWNRSKDLLWAGLSDTASWLEAFLLRLQTQASVRSGPGQAEPSGPRHAPGRPTVSQCASFSPPKKMRSSHSHSHSPFLPQPPLLSLHTTPDKRHRNLLSLLSSPPLT